MRNFLYLCLLFSNLAFASALTQNNCAARLRHHQNLDANFLSRHFLSIDSYKKAYRAVYIDTQDRMEKWKRKVPARPGVALRGMKLSADELNAIFWDGMLVSKAASHYGGALWAAGEIVVPVGFILPTLENLPLKPLAVLFEIDLTGLHTEFVKTIDNKPFYKILQDVPPRSIRRIFIYDPSKDPEDFPFTEVILTETGNGPLGKLTPTSRRARGLSGGKWYRDEAGVEWFVKRDVHFPGLQTSAEVICSKIYRFFGYNTPQTFKIILDGIPYAASRDIGDDNEATDFSNMDTTDIRQLRVIAAYLKDWDRLPTSPNNRLGADGTLTLLDFGGTLGSRAQGYHKEGPVFSDAVGSFEDTSDIAVIYNSFHVGYKVSTPSGSPFSNHPWNRITRKDAELVVEKFRRLDDSTIESIVDSAGYTNERDRNYMIHALKMRRDGIIGGLLSRFP